MCTAGYSLRSGQQACEGQCPLCCPPLDPGPQPLSATFLFSARGQDEFIA